MQRMKRRNTRKKQTNRPTNSNNVIYRSTVQHRISIYSHGCVCVCFFSRARFALYLYFDLFSLFICHWFDMHHSDQPIGIHSLTHSLIQLFIGESIAGLRKVRANNMKKKNSISQSRYSPSQIARSKKINGQKRRRARETELNLLNEERKLNKK